jgi:hypothetical protein
MLAYKQKAKTPKEIKIKAKSTSFPVLSLSVHLNR